MLRATHFNLVFIVFLVMLWATHFNLVMTVAERVTVPVTVTVTVTVIADGCTAHSRL